MSTPASTGPKALPAPDTAAHAPTARVRSSLGNTLVRMDSVTGMIIEAPRPSRPRAAISSALEDTNSHTYSDTAPNSTRPV